MAAYHKGKDIMRRFLLDNDGSNIFGHTMTDDVEACIAEAVEDCPDNVTTYLLCAGAGTLHYPTKVGRVATRFKPLAAALERGLDPFGMFLRGLKQSGKEAFITMRMNDVHDPTDANDWNTPKVRLEHPDAIVDPEAAAEGRGGWMAYCLDYSRPEVREYSLALIREMVESYEFDGLQLDWMRFPRHLSGSPEEVWEKRHYITDFTAEARQILSDSGREILLAARVATSLEGWRFMGLEVPEWTRRGLVDFLVVCPFLTTDFFIPVNELRRELGDYPVPIYAGHDFGFGHQVHFPESLRGVASNLYDCGSDGLYLFNFPCWTEYLAARPYHWLDGLDDPRTAAAKPLLVAVAHERHRIPGVDLPAQIPVRLPTPGTVELKLYVAGAALPARRALLLVHRGGDVSAAINGVACRPLPEINRSEMFIEFIDHSNVENRPAKEDCRVFQVGPAVLVPGHNLVALSSAAGSELTIDRVNLGIW